jgi:glycerophosphoryl diester phosphodiesterase
VKNIFIIAHRGSSFKAPENTMESVKLAWKENTDAVEVDVHASKDGTIVVIHDANTLRTTGKDLTISNSTVGELKLLDAGSWKGKQWIGAKIPTLKEVLQTVPSNKKIFIEIKSGMDALWGVKKLIDESSLSKNQITIMDFDLTTVIKSKEILPEIETVWLKEFPKLKSTNSINMELNEAIEIVLKNNLDGLNVENVEALDSKFILEMKKNNLKCYTWTIDNAERAAELINLGIDGVTTNRPKELRREISERLL